MLGIFAEFERATLIDRVIAGMEITRRNARCPAVRSSVSSSRADLRGATSSLSIGSHERSGVERMRQSMRTPSLYTRAATTSTRRSAATDLNPGDGQIAMGRDISETTHLMPGQARMSCLQRIGKMAGRFANGLEAPNDRIPDRSIFGQSARVIARIAVDALDALFDPR